jgi:hypothetical protein
MKGNKYRVWYNALMVRAKGRVLDDYFENHHIKPRSLGGSDRKSNIVALTYREHFLAHWLLTKWTDDEKRRKMLHALSQMARVSSARRVISGWQYEVAKRARRDAIKGKKFSPEHVARLAATWTEERKANHRAKTLGRKNSLAAIANIKASRTKEVRARISASLTGRKREGFVPWNKGRKLGRKYRTKISATLKGRKQTAEHIANVNAARERRSRKEKAEIHAKISAALKGRKRPKFGAEWRANMSAAQRKRFESQPSL